MYNVFLLSACNLHCEYCFADEIMGRRIKQKNKRSSETNIISLEAYDQILDFLERSQISIVSLIGGEPTLHPDFFSIVERSLERDFTVSVKSNAAWKEDVRQGIHRLPNEGVHFLLNINHPAVLGTRLWPRVAVNARGLKGRRVDFQFNINRVDFEYAYILDLANETQPGKIVWSLSNLVKGETSDSLADPITIREKYSKRLLEFIVEAGKLGFQTVGTHGITPCMFSERDYQELLENGGRLESTCNPVFDILPDLSVLFCFPMSGFWDKKYLYDYRNLQELNLEFQEKLVFMRSELYPLAECQQCEYARLEICHGGCIAQRVDSYAKPRHLHYFDHIPLMSKKFRVEKRGVDSHIRPKEVYCLLNLQSGDQYEIDQIFYSLLTSINGQKSFDELYHDVFPRLGTKPAAQSIFQDIISQLIKRGVLTLMPFTKTNVRDASLHPKI